MKGKVTNMGMKASNKIATFFKYFVLILVGVIMIYPLLWMISATFKDNSEIFAGISLWIKKPTLDGYRNALNNFGGSINILQAMLNTYSYVIPKVICTVVSACIAAYGFGRFDFPGRKLLFNIMLATLFLPQVVLNVPQYLLYNKFGWVDSPFYLAIWVHCAFATETYFVYQLVQFMRNVPRDLDEAAAIDGCSSFQTLYKVIVPMLMPALVSCALFQFMWSCNDFMGPLLYVSTPGKYPMSLFVKLSMDGDTGFAWNKILALSLISILPQLYVVYTSFLKTSGQIYVAGYSLQSYQDMFSRLGRSIQNTIVIPAVSLLIVVFLAVLIAYVAVRRRNVLSGAVDVISMIPYVIPGTVIGIAMISAFNREPLVLTGGMFIMVVALVVRRLPYTIRSSVAILQQIPLYVEEAALSLGSSKPKAFFTVTLPMMSSGVLSGAILSWVTLISELSTAILLYTGKTQTLTVAIYTQIVRGNYGIASAMATVLTVMTLLSLLIFNKISKDGDLTM